MTVIALDKELKIKNAEIVWKKVKEGDEPLQIDCSALEKIDGAGLQLLLYLQLQEYRLSGLSDEIIKTIDLKGYEIKGDEKS